MTVARLQEILGIGVDKMGDAADSLGDADILRLENLDTDLRPPAAALARTREAIDDDAANSYLPFTGLQSLREAAAARVGHSADATYDASNECIVSAGGLSGIL